VLDSLKAEQLLALDLAFELKLVPFIAASNSSF